VSLSGDDDISKYQPWESFVWKVVEHQLPRLNDVCLSRQRPEAVVEQRCIQAWCREAEVLDGHIPQRVDHADSDLRYSGWRRSRLQSNSCRTTLQVTTGGYNCRQFGVAVRCCEGAVRTGHLVIFTVPEIYEPHWLIEGRFTLARTARTARASANRP